MSWLLFDECGARAKRLSVGWVGAQFRIFPGHCRIAEDGPLQGLAHVLGFDPQRTWRPTYFAAKMAKGYRVFELDVGVHEYVDHLQLSEWWQAGAGKWLPHIAAVEMWVRCAA